MGKPTKVYVCFTLTSYSNGITFAPGIAVERLGVKMFVAGLTIPVHNCFSNLIYLCSVGFDAERIKTVYDESLSDSEPDGVVIRDEYRRIVLPQGKKARAATIVNDSDAGAFYKFLIGDQFTVSKDPRDRRQKVYEIGRSSDGRTVIKPVD